MGRRVERLGAVRASAFCPSARAGPGPREPGVRTDPMTGKTFLLNTATRTSDLSRLSGDWFIVAQALGRLPLPWLCLFGMADMDACTLTFMQAETVDGELRHSPRKLSILNPAISVADAKANLARSWPLFELLSGDEQAGKRHWQDAMSALEELPLGYLTIDPTRLLQAGDIEAGTRSYAAAFGTSQAAREAKGRLAGFDPQAADNFDALAGGFLESGAFLRRRRSADEVRELLARIATMAPAASQPRAPSPPPQGASRGADGAPPVSDIWSDERLLEDGRAKAPVTIGRSLFMGARRYYSVRLTNRTPAPMRVREFAAFGRSQQGWQVATRSGEWLSGQAFIDWFDGPADGWIAPGRSVAYLTHTDGDQREAWAFRCEDARQGSFIATAQVDASQSGGRFNGAGWAPGAAVEALGDDLPLVRREIERLIDQLIRRTRESARHELTRDVDGLRWLDKSLDELRRLVGVDELGPLIPEFGAFTGDAMKLGGPGEWVRLGEILCTQIAGAAFLPFQKVAQRLVQGRGSDHTVLGLSFASRDPAAKPLPTQVKPQAGDPEMAQALSRVRGNLAPRRRAMTPGAWAALAGARPAWMRATDALSEAVDKQALLLAEGKVVWGSVVQANNLLFKPGDSDHPAMVVYSRESELDARPAELRAIAQRIYKLKGATPKDPVERAIADKVTNEMDRTMGWRVPVELTARHVLSAAVMVWRKHLPDGVLTGATVPLLVHDTTKAVMIVPAEFWPEAIVKPWKKGKF